MFSRIIAGIIVCFIGFNALVLKFFDTQAHIKATIASFVIGSALGYLSYKGKKNNQKDSK